MMEEIPIEDTEGEDVDVEFEKEIVEPVIEAEEEDLDKLEETEEDSNFLEELKKIRSNPYQYIRNHYEHIYYCFGSTAWSLLALLPPSVIMPKIERDGSYIRGRLNVFILSPPGSGKTSNSVEFSKITYNPIPTEMITVARLYKELFKRVKEDPEVRMSLIISDVASMLQDPIMIKMLEGITDEGVISRNTMQNRKEDTRINVNCISFLSGTPELISNHLIRQGLLFRCLSLMVFHTKEEHEKIIDKISDSIGRSSKQKDSRVINRFYQDLLEIQYGNNEEYEQVTSYEFKDEFKEEVKAFIKPLVKDTFEKYGITFARTVEETFRVMCASAMLNRYNRKVVDGKLFIGREDLDLARKIIRRDISTKAIILKCIEEVDYWNIRTRDQLRKWEMQRKIAGKRTPEQVKMIMEGLVTDKKKR